MDNEFRAALKCITAGSKPSELESETLDFKQDARKLKESMNVLASAARCFANANGGTLVVGVADDVAGSAAIVGTELDPLDAKERIYNSSRPPLLVEAAELWYEQTRLVVITVPSGVENHADSQGRMRHRVGRSCLPMTPREQIIRSEERRGVDWSAKPSEMSISDVDPKALEAARGRLRRADDELRPLADLGNADLLRSLGVVNGQDRLLRAGEALFCAPGDGNPWVVYQHRPTPGGEATAVERLSGPLVTVPDQLVDLVWARRHTTPLTLPDGGQIELADFPREAVREAVVNALLHRELRLDGHVSVEHSPTAFVVESPGRLVVGITEQNILTHPSKPRNPCLFHAARKLRIAEETGRGIDRIYRELIRSGHDTPSISQTDDTTRVVFTGGAPNTQLARFVAQLDAGEREDVDTLLVIFTLLTAQTITETKLAPIIQKQPQEAGAVLKRLAAAESGVLEATLESRTRRKPTYRLRARALRALGGAVAYHRPSIEGAERKVVAHVRDYGRVNNRTVRDLFDIDVHRASALLRGLRNRRLLVKTSKQQRGPGVEYGPGPEFPSR